MNRGDDVKDVAVEFVRALFSGDVETFKALVHPEFESVIIGDLPFAGKRTRKEFLAFLADFRTEFEPGGAFTFTFGKVVADTRTVFMEAESRIPLRNGNLYNNHYVLIADVVDGRVRELKEFGDSRHVATVLSASRFTAATDVSRRINLLYRTPSRTFEGRM